MTDPTQGIEATLHGGPLHGSKLHLPPEAWQKGSFRVAQPIERPQMLLDDGARPAVREVRYSRVHGRPYDFEYVGTL